MQSVLERIANAPAPTVDDLKNIQAFADLPADGLAWLASQMALIEAEQGEILIREGDAADYLIVLLEGEMRGESLSGRVYTASAGRVTGMLPYSRLTVFPTTIYATSHVRIAALSKSKFPEMLERMPILHERLVNVLADRIRETTAADQQREKLMALGKLSAGLAHELNNPASAARRAASNLKTSLLAVHAAALEIDREGLPADARVYVTELERDWATQAGPQTALDTLERSEREEDLEGWLRKHGVARGWELAAQLVDLGCTRATLDGVAEHVPAKFLGNVLIRLAGIFSLSRLSDEIESSMRRITELVQAVKEYSYMDRMDEQEVDIHQGIENTLVLLRHRTKNGIEVVREYDRSLPKLCARGSELNQVWTNLIINALDAMGEKGKLLVRTSLDHTFACVEVIDDGPGIPQDVQSHIFEPFFTTKPLGQGTGLGLDIVHRIAVNHGGSVEFDSRPGRTRFSVRIPIQRPKAA